MMHIMSSDTTNEIRKIKVDTETMEKKVEVAQATVTQATKANNTR